MQQEPERQQPVTGDAGYKQTVQLYECVLADLTHLSLNFLYPVHHKIDQLKTTQRERIYSKWTGHKINMLEPRAFSYT